MCTVSIVPLADGFRLMCNRDEQHTRPPAVPPRWVSLGASKGLMPLDPKGGGSWIAVSETGLVVAVLNRGTPPASDAAEPLHSRGELIPRLISAPGHTNVRNLLTGIEPARYRAFRVVAASGRDVVIGTSNGLTLDITSVALDRPVVFTSSSAGDASAERLRVPLFEALVVRAADPLKGQREFHAHRWPRCGTFSVLMCRTDARTVSRSTIEVRAGMTWFSYEALAADAPCSSPLSR
jgi:hypothetical protein